MEKVPHGITGNKLKFVGECNFYGKNFKIKRICNELNPEPIQYGLD